MARLDEEGRAAARRVVAAIVMLAAAGCGSKPKADPARAAAECTAMRDLGARSLKRWSDLDASVPAEDASLAAIATYTGTQGKTAKAIAADFAKAAPGRADLAEAAEGVRMLGDLAGRKLEAVAVTLRDLDARVPVLSKLESAGNDAGEALGHNVVADVGCDHAKSVGCITVAARMAEIDHPSLPSGFSAAAAAARARAESLDGLASAVASLAASPPKQKARDAAVQHAHEAAAAFRTLAQALDDAVPLEERIGKERREAQEAVARFSAELEAASALCSDKPASSATSPATSSARAPAPSTPPAKAAP